MKFFGLTITRQKAVPTGLSNVDSRGGWWPIVREAFAGAWQRNIEIKVDNVLTYGAVFTCVTLIASDIAKLWVNLVELGDDGVWTHTKNSAHSPVLRRPNHYQNRIQFFLHWIISKLLHGNTYALKDRDARGVVSALYLLDPQRVKVLVAPNGNVYYQLSRDDLSGIGEGAPIVPASEIIHDIMYPLYHPLVGVSPIHACGLAAVQGLKIQNNSAKLFSNGSQLSGVLTAPAAISNEVAQRIQDHWDANFMGEANLGKVAVLGDGLRFEPMTMNAVDAQLIDQLKWADVTVCACFHVPPHMAGVGPAPAYNNIEALNTQYYSQCLQVLIESLELCLDEGLELPSSPRQLGVEFDLDALLLMDKATAIKASSDGVMGGIFTPNEERLKFGRKPVPGGDTPYLQQQNYSLAALNKRDASDDPFATKPTSVELRRAPMRALPPADDDDPDDEKAIAQARTAVELLRKELAA